MDDTYFMKIALEEAKKGIGRTSPNPPVGAVIVKENKIISKGYHEKAGLPHAEVMALEKAGDDARGATIYVTLEPCSHWGKTPPCTSAIINAGIERVVFACSDPSPAAGGGAQVLEQNGINVTSGVFETQVAEILKPFFSIVKLQRPYILLKMAMTLDGKIAVPGRKYLTSQETLNVVHNWRNEFDAIMVGGRTLIKDNPKLDTRYINNGRDPLKIIYDPHMRNLNPMMEIFKKGSILILTEEPNISNSKEKYGFVDAQVDFLSISDKSMHQIFREIGQLGISSILLEGGQFLASLVVESQLVDKICFFYAPILSAGTETISALCTKSSLHNGYSIKNTIIQNIGSDFLITGEMDYSGGF
ncbi:bifunctional diaminohydroxyphosphoribosylaminopyrimidine deaminase/5-amino-6-(5-phosphoribosylamino)uracil reductase RibD [Myxococcota bacterium]|nr:bifunctional diaminohydroxyphosphoribosylaminopyrimidine deaminase/5-amino-6-(5-phosphoribosylamino)uracil reductase RibD [Myxococcota bacterium]MBU1379959.1 bifunctional diaminohydroxyphosphoribosylaminopyrimidine deaminase/5-amino-6-(5-phosphoribosylamino)uracil reductase RibD [Myxococcota bacterium]MBU1496485.1 bifunctional diaminohydroxyphosphoribosylaminopyrimidine deaminase/5-amino-6-(5-phosphoribosylamino)uracil reductase RibD [Myxococcota bacterium]